MARIDIVHAYLDVENETREHIAAPILDAGRRVIWLTSEDELVDAVSDIRVLACGGLADIDWSTAAALELVQVFGSGVNHLPADALPHRTRVANARGIHGGEIRDHALAMTLSFARDLPRIAATQRRHRWAPFAGGTLADKTLGILGLGKIGRSIAAAGRALGMHVIGTRARPEPVPEAEETLLPDDTADVLARSDYVVVCLPATRDTRVLLDTTMLAAMKPHAVLIGLSRGGIIDEEALFDMLRDNGLRGAALDVFAEEPLAEDHPAWDTPNLIVTPHLAGRTRDYLHRAFEVLAANVERLEAGHPLLTPVDLERGY